MNMFNEVERYSEFNGTKDLPSEFAKYKVKYEEAPVYLGDVKK
ncbi:hypothetical protein [Robertmurraya massiliosenegalensis]|nr:hypothetical protein [Robertmurraya massiliosenegalensis]